MNHMPPAPRKFYVTAIDGPRVHFLAGPYETLELAQAQVDTVRILACDFEQNASAGRAHFMAYGVTRTTGGHKTALGVK
jgi:hypothetical protein